MGRGAASVSELASKRAPAGPQRMARPKAIVEARASRPAVSARDNRERK
jgi:hypothetical protein